MAQRLRLRHQHHQRGRNVPHSWTDNKGREHTIPVLNLGMLRDLQADTDIFLPHLLASDDNESKQAIASDEFRILDVLVWLHIGPTPEPTTPEFDAWKQQVFDLQSGVDGDVMISASDALTRAVIDFFPEAKREFLTGAMAKAKEIDQALEAARVKLLNSGEMSTVP